MKYLPSAILLFILISFVECAINPNPKYRVIPIKLGNWVLVEEPASSLFSLIIASLCIKALYDYKKRHDRVKRLGIYSFENYHFHWVWYLFFISFTLSFSWSTLFHVHETILWERLDYIFAILSWGNQVFSALIITLQIKSLQGILLTAIPFVIRNCIFVYWMLFVKFDYSYAVTVVTQYVILHVFFWVPWALYMRFKLNMGYANYILLGHLLVGFFVIFEVMDFPPVFRIFDGHSLWHLGHVLMVICWLNFIKGHSVVYNYSR